MNRSKRSMALITAVSCLAVAPVLADTEDRIQLQMKVEKEISVIDENGEAQLQRVAPELVIPGEEVIYTITYRNVGDDPADNVVITNPIPQELIYTPQSASGVDAAILFSVNGTDFGTPDQLRVETTAGAPRRPDSNEYTHIRWVLTQPLGSGLEGEVSYRVRLE